MELKSGKAFERGGMITEIEIEIPTPSWTVSHYFTQPSVM